MHVENMKARFRAARHVMVSVHRGLWGPLPENSLPGIRAASDWDVVEVDVQLDAQGNPYLIHDDTLTRMTGADAASDGADPTLISSLRLKEGMGGDDAAFTDEPVPDLAAAFAALGPDAVFDLDVKRDKDIEPVATHVVRLGGQGRATLKIDTPDARAIARLQSLESNYDIMVMAKLMLRSKADLDLMEQLRAANVAMAEVYYGSLDLLEQACAIGGDVTGIGIYTLDGIHCCGMADAKALEDPDAVWGRLIDAGVAQIMTDRARQLSDYLAAR